MKILITLFVLFFSSLVFAEDISDYEIEGMSIGDSLLEYFSDEIINAKIKNSAFYFDNSKFMIILFEDSSFSTYQFVQVTLKPNDDQYFIHSLTGKIIYNKETDECFKKK